MGAKHGIIYCMEKYINKVFMKDIMELLKKLPDRCVDMVYGDPDYNVGIKYLDNACYEVLDYVWVYNTNVGHSPKRFTTAHRSILHCRKTKDNKFYKDSIAVPYKNPTDRRILQNLANGSKGRMPYSWFYFDLVKNVSKEKTFHACQIPQKLSEMLIKSCTMEGDSVLILFGGSGSEICLCKELKRNFISAEVDAKYHKMIMDRIEKGFIDKEYKLKLRQYDQIFHDSQIELLEPHAPYRIRQGNHK